MISSLVFLFADLVTGNIVWQAFYGRQWEAAAERSYFQLIALVGAYLVLRFK